MTNVRRTIVRLTAAVVLMAIAFSASTLPADDGNSDSDGSAKDTGMPSELILDLLSSNMCKLLADNVANLLSGNSPKLLADNEPELLSGNEAEILSGNEVELLSGNAPQFFSNISVEIEVSSSGNTGPPPPINTRAAKPKQRGKHSRLDEDDNGTVSLREFTATKAGKKARRAKKRFEKLDVDGNGMLTFEEFTLQGNGGRVVAVSETP